MRLLLVVGLLCLYPGYEHYCCLRISNVLGIQAASYFSEGHLDTISADEVSNLDHETFLVLENRVKQSFASCLGLEAEEFVLDTFE